MSGAKSLAVLGALALAVVVWLATRGDRPAGTGAADGQASGTGEKQKSATPKNSSARPASLPQASTGRETRAADAGDEAATGRLVIVRPRQLGPRIEYILDGESIGSGAKKVLSVQAPAGSHNLAIRMSGRDWWHREVIVVAGKETMVTWPGGGGLPPRSPPRD